MYQSLGILHTELQTPLSRSSLLRDFLSQIGPFSLFNKPQSDRAKYGEYGGCGKMVYPRDANICAICLVLLLDSGSKTHKDVAENLTVDCWPLGIPLN